MKKIKKKAAVVKEEKKIQSNRFIIELTGILSSSRSQADLFL